MISGLQCIMWSSVIETIFLYDMIIEKDSF